VTQVQIEASPGWCAALDPAPELRPYRVGFAHEMWIPPISCEFRP